MLTQIHPAVERYSFGAMFLSAFAALRDLISRAYYTRKISQGKRHNQALIVVAPSHDGGCPVNAGSLGAK